MGVIILPKCLDVSQVKSYDLVVYINIFLHLGETVVLVGLYGPADCKESKQDVKQAVVEVNFRPKVGIPAIAEKYLEKYVKSIAETVIQRFLHPRSLFSIIVQVMQDQGSVSFFITALLLKLIIFSDRQLQVLGCVFFFLYLGVESWHKIVVFWSMP